MRNYNNRRRDKLFLIIVPITLLFIAMALGLYFWNFRQYGFSNKTADWASFGAYVGGVLGTCFAFATFWMLFSTFRLQQKQLKNVEVQKFETTFYSLLEQYNQKLNELKLDSDKLLKLFDGDPRIGQALTIPDEEFNRIDDPSVFESKESKYNDSEEYLEKLKEEILEDVELSQYLRVLYQLLKYIATNNIKNPNRRFDIEYLCNVDNVSINYEKMYSSIVRAFVPVPLLPILALNCINTPKSIDNLNFYQALLERYNFLEHIRFDLLPQNLAMFVIFNNYNDAIGNNDKASVIALQLKEKYKNHSVKPKSYFSCSQDTVNSPTEANKNIGNCIETHLGNIGKGFYSDDATIHEAILFLISGVSTSVFLLTFPSYVIGNFSKIINIDCLLLVALIFLSSILTITALYVMTITGGRLATTLGKRNVTRCKALAYIFTITLVAFFTILIYIVILTPISG